MTVLLIGNGSSVLEEELGEKIDNFNGTVVRMNSYQTKGFEKQVGTRTDVWFTCVCRGHEPGMSDPHIKDVIFVSHLKEKDRENHPHWIKIKKRYPNVRMTSIPLMNYTRQRMSHVWPSTGAVALMTYFGHGHDVYLHGIDFMISTVHRNYFRHGLKDASTKMAHMQYPEWLFFNRFLEYQNVNWFSESPSRTKFMRTPLECGTDEDISYARGFSQGGWYKWIAEQCKDGSVVDIGPGMCNGLEILQRGNSHEVLGIEVDKRLEGYSPFLRIMRIEDLKNKSFDYVVSVDTLEHVFDDIDHFKHMKRVARKKVFIVTPHLLRSWAKNNHHAREYSIPQFVNTFQPTHIWGGSPGGDFNVCPVLVGEPNSSHMNYKEVDMKGRATGFYRDYIPVSHRFDNTADGLEWAHFCGIFDVG